MTREEKKALHDYICRLTIEDVHVIVKNMDEAVLVHTGLIKILNFLSVHGFGRPHEG